MNYFLFFLMSLSLSAQTKGIVKDSITQKPISYVNIWIENENIGTTSEENGEFLINNSKNKKLVFSALGYEKKIAKTSNNDLVYLKPTDYQLQEVVIAKHFETKQIEIGKTNSTIFQAFDNGPKIEAKYFPYLSKYKKTRYIKQVFIETDSKIDNVTIKIHFYNVDANGFPGNELLTKDFLVSIKQGVLKSIFDVSNLNLKFPKTGLFVGYEKLIIEKNKTEQTILNANNNTTSVKKIYYPFVLYNFVERDFQYTFSGGNWSKQVNNSSQKSMIYEPAINLILTN